VMEVGHLWGLSQSHIGMRGEKAINRICSTEQFAAILDQEKARVERNAHRFSLVLFDVGKAGANISQARYLAHVLVNRVRRTDEVGWFDNKRIGVILPEASEVGTQRLADDVCKAVIGKTSPPEYTVYTYPSALFSSRNGHSGQLSFADISPQWEIVTSRGFSASVGRDGQRSSAFGAKKLSAGVAANDSAWGQELEPFFLHATRIWKRVFDIAGSIVALIILSPLFLLVSLLIKAVSEGPVFFKQQRVGYKGQTFTMWKFRTFKVNTDPTEHRRYVTELINGARHDGMAGEQKPMTKLSNSEDKILFGRILRVMCIDELPQLINVLRGEMSLVGPRPPLSYEVEEYLPWHLRRLDVLPGMTGLWQVSGKNRLSFNEMVRLDIQYSRQQSIWLDIKILLKTPLAIVSQIKDRFVLPKNGRNAVLSEGGIEHA
jgi:lipopolysaccharide/colanic/teichoic acid biosynthesis glycosyltransferase